MSKAYYYGVGIVLILMGIAIPSSCLIELLRETPINDLQKGLLEQLLLGAMLFKIGLAILGLAIIGLSRLSIWNLKSQGENPISDPDKRLRITVLVGILLAATLLRLYGLNYGLWYDEILTYVNYFKMPYGEIIFSYDSLNQHFLYSLFAHTSFLIFGESAWSLRLPAVIFGVGSLWALYLFGREVTSARETLLSVALLAFSYHHIWFSQNARGYTALLFFTLITSWLFIRGLCESLPQTWLLYALVAAFGVYTHITMLFVIVGHFIIYIIGLFNRRREIWPGRWIGFFLGFCLTGFFIFQLYALVLPQIFGSIISEKSPVTAWNNPLWTILKFVEGLEISFGGSFTAFAALLVFGVGLVSFMREKPVVIQLLFIPALICVAVVTGMVDLLYPRFLFFSVGFGVLVIIRGTMLLGHTAGRLLGSKSTISASVGTALSAVLILAAGISGPLAYGPKQDYLGALAFVEKEKHPEDIIVTAGLATFPYKSFYKMEWEEVNNLPDLNSIRSRAKRTWLLYTLPLHLQSAYPEIMDCIQEDFEVVKQFYGTLGGGTIFVCVSNMPPS